MTKKIAVITGASSGLGAEYLAQVSKEYPELDEIIIIARRADRLTALCEKYTKASPLPLDLTLLESFDILKERLESENADVLLLINNSGCGVLGNFADCDFHPQLNMIDVNVKALTGVTHAVLPFMKESAQIICVSSIAAFVPTPRMAVYCSTKAYVQSFCKALRFELKPRKINVLAVCPGPMSTEFLETANIPGNSKAFETLPRVKVSAIAQNSIKASKNGRGVYTGKALYKVYRVLGKILPHTWLMHMTKV